jgi:hypothetical protein
MIELPFPFISLLFENSLYKLLGERERHSTRSSDLGRVSPTDGIHTLEMPNESVPMLGRNSRNGIHNRLKNPTRPLLPVERNHESVHLVSQAREKARDNRPLIESN